MHLDFVVPGFSKCGTTSLCALLSEHPELFIPKGKEPSFFASNFGLGWQWYEGLFKHAVGKRLLGEGSTLYSTGEHGELACERIVHHSPRIRVIFIARDPVARLESSYREMHHSGHKYGIAAPYSIDATLRQFPNMIQDTLYWERISTFRKRIPDSRILVLFAEDFARHPAAELARCFEFLGVDPGVRIDNLRRRLNSGDSKQHDSRLLRWLRSHPWTKRYWSRLSKATQDRLVRQLKLRKPFTKPIAWRPATQEWVRRQIAEDARQFLAFYGKPLDFWKLAPDGAPAGRTHRAAA